MEEEKGAVPSSEEQQEANEDVVAKTNEAAARLEKATAELSAKMEQAKALKFEEMLGGKSETKVQQKEESDSDYARRALAGEFNDQKDD